MNTAFFRAAVCAAMLLLAASGPSAVLAQQSVGVTVVVNGSTMQFDQPPVEQAGRVFVPLRGIFEQLGASVVYQNGQINATGDGRNVSLQIGSTNATVNGQTQTLDSPPFVEGSRTLVPLRFVAQALGANVDWNNNTSTVTITGGGNRGGGGGYNPRPRPPMNATAYLSNREPQGLAQGHMPVISADFAVPVQRSSVRISLDGYDITSNVNFNGNGFEYTTRRPLSPGSHTVRVTGTTRDGGQFDTAWDFRV
jgi:Copper amine oxidase N-terminal domain